MLQNRTFLVHWAAGKHLLVGDALRLSRRGDGIGLQLLRPRPSAADRSNSETQQPGPEPLSDSQQRRMSAGGPGLAPGPSSATALWAATNAGGTSAPANAADATATTAQATARTGGFVVACDAAVAAEARSGPGGVHAAVVGRSAVCSQEVGLTAEQRRRAVQGRLPPRATLEKVCHRSEMAACATAFKCTQVGGAGKLHA